MSGKVEAVRAKVTGMDHVSVTSRDLDASIAFYVDLLGLPLTARGESEDVELAVMMGQDHVSIRWADLEVGEALTLELVESSSPSERR